MAGPFLFLLPAFTVKHGRQAEQLQTCIHRPLDQYGTVIPDLESRDG